ncbi:MAG: hypothetical protein ACREUD_01480 [Gammaproteobacteria bacterium]
MGWSLSYLPEKEPELLDRFFLSLGKALYLSSEFEKKCQFVLRIAKLEDRIRTMPENLEDFTAFAKAIRDPLLGPAFREMRGLPTDFRDQDIAVLERGRLARNYIAHEASLPGGLWHISADEIEKHVDSLRVQVILLATADNLVSAWAYQIEEREPFLPGIHRDYERRVLRWVFGDEAGD